MVKKSNGKRRMRTGYTDLNKACPKDPYPLPNIDALVDGASDFGLLSFMNTYSSYNQIKMHPCDKTKTALITDEGNFYYRVMPFGLKNAGATYQRVMDRIFKNHIGHQVEVYMDDMVIKSSAKEKHAKNLASIFIVLRTHQLKLNLDKCSFGVKAGKFFGFWCSTFINMRSPKSVKETDQGPSPFPIPICRESAPIFQSLRRSKRFRWSGKYEVAFQELKAMLTSPPIITRPAQAKPIIVYIYVSDNVVSSAIIQETEEE
ncbi:hypothetical protein CR513_12306, partial [Mucuna pruriens]